MRDQKAKLMVIASNIEQLDINVTDEKRDRFENILYPALEQRDPGYEMSIAEVVMMLPLMTAQHLYNSLEQV